VIHISVADRLAAFANLDRFPGWVTLGVVDEGKGIRHLVTYKLSNQSGSIVIFSTSTIFVLIASPNSFNRLLAKVN